MFRRTSWFEAACHDPVTIGTIGAVAAAAGATVGAAGLAAQSAQAERVADINADVAAQEAEQRRQAGAIGADNERRRVQKILSAQRARFAAQGTTLDAGPLDIMAETAAEGELAALTAQYQGTLAARQADIAGIQATAEGRAARAGQIAAGARLLEGGSQFARQYSDLGLLEVDPVPDPSLQIGGT